MGLQALGHQVHGRVVAGIVGGLEHGARGAAYRLVAGNELLHHALPVRHAVGALLLADRSQADELGIGAGGVEAQRAGALGHLVQRVPLLGVLGLEHVVQRVEHWPGHVPVEVVGLQVQGERVGEVARKSFGDLLPVARGNADVDPRGRGDRVERPGDRCLGLAGLAGLARLAGLGLGHERLLWGWSTGGRWGCHNRH